MIVASNDCQETIAETAHSSLGDIRSTTPVEVTEATDTLPPLEERLKKIKSVKLRLPMTDSEDVGPKAKKQGSGIEKANGKYKVSWSEDTGNRVRGVPLKETYPQAPDAKKVCRSIHPTLSYPIGLSFQSTTSCNRCANAFKTGVYVCRISQLPDRKGKCEKCFLDAQRCSLQDVPLGSNSGPVIRGSGSTIVIGKRNRDQSPICLGSDGEEASLTKKKARYGRWCSSFMYDERLHILEGTAPSTITIKSAASSSSRSLSFPAGGVYLDCVFIPPVFTAGYVALPKARTGPSITQLTASAEMLQEDIERRQAVIQSHLALLRSAKTELRRIENQLDIQYSKGRGNGE